MRIWEDKFLISLHDLEEINSSLFKHLLECFARTEYQKDKGNVYHAHMMEQLLWQNMTQEERDLVNTLL